jgi:hypothetical protein
MESDQRYYARRAAEEQRRAAHAVTAEARERHRELASLFRTKAEGRSHAEALQAAH